MLREIIVKIRGSKKAASFFVIMITLSYSGQALLHAWEADPQPDYNIFMVPFLNHCNPLQYPQRDGYALQPDNLTAIHNGVYSDTRDPLKWWVDCASWDWLGHSKILPIIFSIGLMPLVYLLSVELTKDRIIGLLSLSAFVMNPLYTDWISSITYDQEWSFFLILSTYLMFKAKSIGAIPSFMLGIAAKGLGLLYLPVWLYTLWHSNQSRTVRVLSIGIMLGATVSIGFILLPRAEHFVGGAIGFYPDHANDALMRNFDMFWPEIPFLMAFAGINATFHAKSRPANKKVVILWMISALITTPLIYLFTTQFVFVYRFVPFAVFMSIFFAMVIVETGNFVLESRLNVKPREKKPLLRFLKECYLG